MSEIKNTFRTRSDLACETASKVLNDSNFREYTRYECKITKMLLSDTEDESDTGEQYQYVTIETGRIWAEGQESVNKACCAIAEEIKEFTNILCGENKKRKLKVLVAGLGNRFITADALGPKCVDKLVVTGHLGELGERFFASADAELYAIHPGVLGQTGIEAANIVKGAAHEVNPDLIIAVDALCAKSLSRLSSTVQLSDKGIAPGSGIGNRRLAINHEVTGAPVLSIGVPTVVDSSTLVIDALEKAELLNEQIPQSLHEVLNSGKSFFVSPKESDVIIDCVAEVLSSAIHKAFNIELPY